MEELLIILVSFAIGFIGAEIIKNLIKGSNTCYCNRNYNYSKDSLNLRLKVPQYEVKKVEKELLLQDLCARLPYKPFARWYHKALNKFRDVKIMEISTYGKNIDDYHINVLCQPEPGVDYEASIVDIKPYLRPMSSMTEEEMGEYNLTKTLSIVDYPTLKSFDWLNAHHFDYRGLIEKDLAIEVTEENNPYKE